MPPANKSSAIGKCTSTTCSRPKVSTSGCEIASNGTNLQYAQYLWPADALRCRGDPGAPVCRPRRDAGTSGKGDTSLALQMQSRVINRRQQLLGDVSHFL